MNRNIFKDFAANENNKNWDKLIERNGQLYRRTDDVRSEFLRDYTRILHSNAYRRLKHKTQVFFNIDNDHICTRMEHVNHVESVSSTIANYLGLNPELTKAISLGHDLGHAPFGHPGEKILSEIAEKYLGKTFWHERNSLRIVDDIELLEDTTNNFRNLSLTYAVRDGIISHCGEVDENGLHPRENLIPLEQFESPGQYQPATWEGCIVKISDKIAYLGRDIEDAIELGFITDKDKKILIDMARVSDESALNTTVIINNMINDICRNSSPDKGICLSQKFVEQMDELKEYNYDHIYRHERLKPFARYSKLVVTEMFDLLYNCFDGKNTWNSLKTKLHFTPKIYKAFTGWLAHYCNVDSLPEGPIRESGKLCLNHKIFGDLSNEEDYIRAILYFIAGMTDKYIITLYSELLSY